MFLLNGCSQGFLELQPKSNIFIPERAEDFQRLLDNFELIGSVAVLPQLSADEYFISTEANWLSSRTAVERNTYVWGTDVYGAEVNIEDWNSPYRTVFYVNNIIGQIDRGSDPGDLGQQLSDIYGQALFFRAAAYYDLVSNFSVPFDASTQATDLGVPIRRDPSIDYTSARASVKECYDLIFEDLSNSLLYLRNITPVPERNRPTKLAVYGLLARIHLYRREYDEAEKWASTFLEAYDKLVDYNDLSLSGIYPFTISHDELVMYGKSSIYNNARCNNTTKTVFVDTALMDMYHGDDLRRSVYFRELEPGRFVMKAGYNGITLGPFTGIAVDEVMLVRAECMARRGDLAAAGSLMNTLLEKRYRTGTYVPIAFDSPAEAREFVLMERRKELVWRCRRWEDIKRLNKEGANIVLRRRLGSTDYLLQPNSPRYVFNIPQDEVNRSGIKQNKR